MQPQNTSITSGSAPGETFGCASVAKRREDVDDLIKDLDAPTLWCGTGLVPGQPVTDHSLNEVQALIRRLDMKATSALASTARHVNIRHIVRTAAFKNEALAVESYLEFAFLAEKITVAANAKDVRGKNAAVLRLISARQNNAGQDKYRISRNAHAMMGVEVYCQRRNLALTFETADEAYELVRHYSRAALCEIADDGMNPTPPTVPGAAATRAPTTSTSDTRGSDASTTAQADQSTDQELSAPPQKDDAEGGATNANDEAGRVTALQSILDRLPDLASLAIPPKHAPKSDVFLAVVIRNDGFFTLKGPLCSGSAAIQAAERLFSAVDEEIPS